MTNQKKKATISVKFNEEPNILVYKDDVFPLVLPEELTEKVISIDEVRKKKKKFLIRKLKGKEIKLAEIFLLIFFAVIIGGILGINLLKLLPQNPEQISSKVNIVLEPVQAFVLQQGVYNNKQNAELSLQQFENTQILKTDKYYILNDISNEKDMSNGFVKQIEIPKLNIKVDEQLGKELYLIREILVGLIAKNINEQTITQLKNVNESSIYLLKESAQIAIDNRNTDQMNKTLLQFFIQYYQFVYSKL